MKDVKAKILQNKKIYGSYYKMLLDAPYIAKNATPGQFVQIRCSEGTDPLLRRPFSVHRITGDKIEILYEKIGKGTEVLSQKKSGELFDILGPLGNGFTLPRTPNDKRQTPILIAGGIGVAPLFFLAEELTRKKIKVSVLIGAQTKDLILCEKDFRKTGAEVHIATDDGSKGCRGFVSELFKEVLRTTCLPAGKRTTIYACGPEPMLRNIAGICRKNEISCEISLEEKMACGIGACLGCAVKVKGGGYKLACKDGPVFNIDELI